MPIESLQQLSMWLDAAGIGLLELRGPGVWLRLGRDAAVVAEACGQSVAVPAAIRHAATSSTTVNARAAGRFLHAHPMQSAPLASIGAQVRAGAPVGLLQIGALLLPVLAPRSAVIAGLPVAHGTVVGYGTPLVELDPD